MSEPFAYKMQRLLNERVKNGGTFTRYHYAMRQAARKAIMAGRQVTEESFASDVQAILTKAVIK